MPIRILDALRRKLSILFFCFSFTVVPEQCLSGAPRYSRKCLPPSFRAALVRPGPCEAILRQFVRDSACPRQVCPFLDSPGHRWKMRGAGRVEEKPDATPSITSPSPAMN
jgi:hypothetical protein